MGDIPWNELFQRLDAVAAKLGIVGGQVYQLAVRQALIHGIVTALFCAIVVIACGFGAVVLLKRACTISENQDTTELGYYGYRQRNDDSVIFSIMIAVVFAGMAIVAGVFLVQAILKILNPGFAGIQEILNLVR